MENKDIAGHVGNESKCNDAQQSAGKSNSNRQVTAKEEAPSPAEVARVVAASTLPEHIKAAIAAMIGSIK